MLAALRMNAGASSDAQAGQWMGVGLRAVIRHLLLRHRAIIVKLLRCCFRSAQCNECTSYVANYACALLLTDVPKAFSVPMRQLPISAI